MNSFRCDAVQMLWKFSLKCKNIFWDFFKIKKAFLLYSRIRWTWVVWRLPLKCATNLTKCNQGLDIRQSSMSKWIVISGWFSDLLERALISSLKWLNKKRERKITWRQAMMCFWYKSGQEKRIYEVFIENWNAGTANIHYFILKINI